MCILKFSKKENSIQAMPLSITLLQMQHHHDLHQLTTNVKPPPYGAWLRARGSPWPNATHGAKKKNTRGLAFGKLKRCVKKAIDSTVKLAFARRWLFSNKRLPFKSSTPPNKNTWIFMKSSWARPLPHFFGGWETIWRRLKLGSGNG